LPGGPKSTGHPGYEASAEGEAQKIRTMADRAARKEHRATLSPAELKAENNRAQLLGSLTAAVTVIGRLAPYLDELEDWKIETDKLVDASAVLLAIVARRNGDAT
jgi:hypothetical protein